MSTDNNHNNIQDEIREIKQEGNSYFQNKNYEIAIKYYTKGLNYDYDYDYDCLIELRQSLFLNRAKAYFKLNNLKNALIDSSNCIKSSINPTKFTYKAQYTRAEIYASLNDYKNAIKHCDEIIKVYLFIYIYLFILALRIK